MPAAFQFERAQIMTISYTGFMCKTEFDFELTNGGARVYSTIGELKQARQGVDYELGIVEVEVRLTRVVAKSDAYTAPYDKDYGGT